MSKVLPYAEVKAVRLEEGWPQQKIAQGKAHLIARYELGDCVQALHAEGCMPAAIAERCVEELWRRPGDDLYIEVGEPDVRKFLFGERRPGRAGALSPVERLEVRLLENEPVDVLKEAEVAVHRLQHESARVQANPKHDSRILIAVSTTLNSTLEFVAWLKERAGQMIDVGKFKRNLQTFKEALEAATFLNEDQKKQVQILAMQNLLSEDIRVEPERAVRFPERRKGS